MADELKLVAEQDPAALAPTGNPHGWTDEEFAAWKAEQRAKNAEYEAGRHLWREMNPKVPDSTYDGPKTIPSDEADRLQAIADANAIAAKGEPQ